MELAVWAGCGQPTLEWRGTQVAETTWIKGWREKTARLWGTPEIQSWPEQSQQGELARDEAGFTAGSIRRETFVWLPGVTCCLKAAAYMLQCWAFHCISGELGTEYLKSGISQKILCMAPPFIVVCLGPPVPPGQLETQVVATLWTIPGGKDHGRHPLPLWFCGWGSWGPQRKSHLPRAAVIDFFGKSRMRT